MITLTLNGRKVKAREDATLLEICRKMSIPIPTLCYHPDLEPHGSCRLCVVEVTENGKTRMVTSCNYPAREGIRVETQSDKVVQARRILAGLLLARCPQAPFVQELARELGAERSPFKADNPGNDCILCGLCVRTCKEIVGANAIGFSKRGTQKRIGTPFEVDSDQCIACGACEYVCPTGAVKMEMDRIRKIRQSDTGTLRACRYMRLGLVDFMVCSNGFECWRCEVDQRMEDRYGTHPAFALKPAKTKEPHQVSGFTYYPEYLYSKGHLWAKSIDSHMRLGFDGLLANLAMEADSMTLPPVGSTLKKNQVLVEISSNGKKAPILSPLAGTVFAVNRDLEESPDLAWRDPYQRGWLLMIDPSHPEEISRLYSGDPAKTWFSQEAKKLEPLFAERTSKSSKKDGPPEGRWVRKIIHENWDKLKEILLEKEGKFKAQNPKMETRSAVRNRRSKSCS
jgi:bidirectional [NiFe] hydrogenase diaphorase subunit